MRSGRLRYAVLLALVAGAALAVGHSLPRRAEREGDMLDAVAEVQRRAPLFLISEPHPVGNWTERGALYLCRSPKTVVEVERLSKWPGGKFPWDGVVCFRGTSDPGVFFVPWVSEGRCLHYGRFAVHGDPELLEEVRLLLAEAGFRAERTGIVTWQGAGPTSPAPAPRAAGE
jgi:hypothetical protein